MQVFRLKIAVLFVFGLILIVFSSLPPIISFQGIFSYDYGSGIEPLKPFSETPDAQFKFSLFSNKDIGTPELLWQEETGQQYISIQENGKVSIILGKSKPIQYDKKYNEASNQFENFAWNSISNGLWLQIEYKSSATVNYEIIGDSRLRLTAALYSLESNNIANKIGGINRDEVNGITYINEKLKVNGIADFYSPAYFKNDVEIEGAVTCEKSMNIYGKLGSLSPALVVVAKSSNTYAAEFFDKDVKIRKGLNIVENLNVGSDIVATGNIETNNNLNVALDASFGRDLTVVNNVTVSGNLSVANDIIVGGWTITTTPDYVFKSDYDLMPIDALDKYTKINKHLPGVPSAKEVEKNGVSVGEMDRLLLKKVEELTLYIIQQNKIVKSLERDIRKLKGE